MTGRLLPALLLSTILAACGADNAPLTASEVSILAPLPGQESAAAYLTLRNESSRPVVVAGVSSPEFATVEMHATVFSDGIAEMLRIDTLTVAADSEIEFSTGGKHLMLLDPRVSLAPGDDVTLEFQYGSDGALAVRAPLQSRAIE